MKRIFCLAFCLIAVLAVFTGCSKENTPPAESTAPTAPQLTETTITTTEPEISGIHYCGLNTMSITAEQLAEAIGMDAEAVISTETGSGEELLIVNDTLYYGILYKQLQCINYEDKTVITLTYTLDDETLEDSLKGIADSFGDQFGTPSVAQSSTGNSTYTWRISEENGNYIILYPINDTELKLSFYLF